jgi:hypothetical protein
MSLDFDAICETSPTITQVSYDDLLTAMVNKTVVTVRIESPVTVGSSLGEAYYHKFFGYITDLTLNQSTTEFINFSGTIQSTGALDVTI